MASVYAGRSVSDGSSGGIVALDGAKKLGAKILVAGGGRCNVTHHKVDASSYAGSSTNAIQKVLRRYPVSETVAFFAERGVELKREETGKLFPTTDKARDVLEALKGAVKDAGASIEHPWRVESVERTDDGFIVRESPATAPDGIPREIHAERVILAAGGRALPKSGSDGAGHRLARMLGHSVTERIFPALVPLTVEGGHFVRELSGIATDVRAEVRAGSGKVIKRIEGPALCTHFGLSGPAPMNISRYLHEARADDASVSLVVNWLPVETFESLDTALTHLGKKTVLGYLKAHLPERLARALCEFAGVSPETSGARLTKDARRALVRAVCESVIPVTGDRGWSAAEVTAGGVPLDEVDLKTMESKLCPGLHLCGEVLDADGLIGGFNFQWAWASGFIAGSSAGTSLRESHGASSDAAR